MLVDIDEGDDPIATKAQARVDDRQLFGVLADEYLAIRTRDMKPRSLEQCRMHLQKYFAPLHRLPLNRIDRAMVAAELRTIAKERGPVAANRGRSRCRPSSAGLSARAFWKPTRCWHQQVRESAGRERVLTDSELVAIWNAAPASDYGRIIKLLMLTGQRRDEIAELAVGRNRGRCDRPAQGAHQERPGARRAAVATGEGRAGRGAGACRAGSRVWLWQNGLHRLFARQGTAGRGLRRSGVGRARSAPHSGHPDGRPGRAAHIIEAVLNHVTGHKAGVAGIYNRSAYAAEKRAALICGAATSRICWRGRGANVTMLRSRLLGVWHDRQ